MIESGEKEKKKKKETLIPLGFPTMTSSCGDSE